MECRNFWSQCRSSPVWLKFRWLYLFQGTLRQASLGSICPFACLFSCKLFTYSLLYSLKTGKLSQIRHKSASKLTACPRCSYIKTMAMTQRMKNRKVYCLEIRRKIASSLHNEYKLTVKFPFLSKCTSLLLFILKPLSIG